MMQKKIKSYNKGGEALNVKWSEIVAGTSKRNVFTSKDANRNIQVINTMPISRVQLLPNTKENIVTSQPKSPVVCESLDLGKEEKSPKHKIVLISDSHAGGCETKLRDKLKEQHEVVGYVIPGAEAAVLTKTVQQEISRLTEKDIPTYFGGSNDITKNNSSRGLKLMHHYLIKNCHTKIIMLEVPPMYDLMEASIINDEVKIHNRKLNSLTSKYRHTSVMQLELAREDFTKHGLYLRNAGKGKLVSLLIENIARHQQKAETETPISLGWKMDSLSDQPDEKLENKVNKDRHQRIKGNAHEVQLYGGHVVEDKNFGNPPKPKRIRKAPTPKTDYFLW
jgi:hypothetical protein